MGFRLRMRSIPKYYKIIFAATSMCGGAILIHYAFCDTEKFRSANISQSYNSSIKWDWNWDRRDPCSSPEEENDLNNNEDSCNAKKTKAVRNIILIRHGQYNMTGKIDDERILTPLGEKQAECTGERLKNMNYPYTSLISSTMVRANQTANIIQLSLKDLSVEKCSLLEEGSPIPPDPPSKNKHPEHKFFQDGARIEAAFRKYFYRASPPQKTDSYDIVVCHANVIRYFVCRALQLPPEAWLRMSLFHCGITWLAIHPNGFVSLRAYGDSGHIPRDMLTR